jgi:hypothetical protein
LGSVLKALPLPVIRQPLRQAHRPPSPRLRAGTRPQLPVLLLQRLAVLMVTRRVSQTVPCRQRLLRVVQLSKLHRVNEFPSRRSN